MPGGGPEDGVELMSFGSRKGVAVRLVGSSAVKLWLRRYALRRCQFAATLIGASSVPDVMEAAPRDEAGRQSEEGTRDRIPSSPPEPAHELQVQVVSTRFRTSRCGYCHAEHSRGERQSGECQQERACYLPGYGQR